MRYGLLNYKNKNYKPHSKPNLSSIETWDPNICLV